jgi:hypothetical protein
MFSNNCGNELSSYVECLRTGLVGGKPCKPNEQLTKLRSCIDVMTNRQGRDQGVKAEEMDAVPESSYLGRLIGPAGLRSLREEAKAEVEGAAAAAKQAKIPMREHRLQQQEAKRNAAQLAAAQKRERSARTAAAELAWLKGQQAAAAGDKQLKEFLVATSSGAWDLNDLDDFTRAQLLTLLPSPPTQGGKKSKKRKSRKGRKGRKSKSKKGKSRKGKSKKGKTRRTRHRRR